MKMKFKPKLVSCNIKKTTKEKVVEKMEINTTVSTRRSRVDQVGNLLIVDIIDMPGETLTVASLALQLVEYADERIKQIGFDFVKSERWRFSVYTLDGDEPETERSYTVRYTNHVEGYIEVVGILISDGRPSLDHGFYVGSENDYG